MYEFVFRTLLTKMDPEQAHLMAHRVIQLLPTAGIGSIVRRFTMPRTDQTVRALGLTFPTPFGIAAGFDKEGTAIRGLGQLGFGHVEVGTLTAHPQPGNEKPRLFRLVDDRAVINRMGFNNGGAAEARPRFVRERARFRRPIIGANIGKSRIVQIDDAIDDYVRSATLLAPVADYLVVNVSSPNTPGLRGLQELERLRPLLAAVKTACGNTPLLVKIAPDLSDEGIAEVAQLVLELSLDGIIATNTTLSREGLVTPQRVVDAAGDGGLSGAPLANRSLEALRLIRSLVPADLCVISVGGVDTAKDVAERLDAGATLVQGYTAFLYRGPFWARNINRGLDARSTRSRSA